MASVLLIAGLAIAGYAIGRSGSSTAAQAKRARATAELRSERASAAGAYRRSERLAYRRGVAAGRAAGARTGKLQGAAKGKTESQRRAAAVAAQTKPPSGTGAEPAKDCPNPAALAGVHDVSVRGITCSQATEAVQQGKTSYPSTGMTFKTAGYQCEQTDSYNGGTAIGYRCTKGSASFRFISGD